MSGFFLPIVTCSFSDSYIDMETTRPTGPELEAELYTYEKLELLEKKGTSSLDLLSIFAGYVYSRAVQFLFFAFCIKVLFFIPWVQFLPIWATLTLGNIIHPSPIIKQQAPTLFKMQKILHKLATIGTLFVHLYYALTIPSPINIATALIMLVIPVLFTYNENILTNHIKTFTPDRQTIIFHRMINLIGDTNNPTGIKKMLYFNTINFIALAVITVLSALVPIHTNPLQNTLATLFFYYRCCQLFFNLLKTMVTLSTAYATQIPPVQPPPVQVLPLFPSRRSLMKKG